MSEYEQYVTYRNAQDQIRERVAQTQRPGLPRKRRKHPGRHALARRLHSIADRIDL
jgi:hypothetical protein